MRINSLLVSASLMIMTVVGVSSFVSPSSVSSCRLANSDVSLNLFTSCRRDFFAAISVASSSLVAIPKDADASGGATAGGAYLLSAKQRYNQRVTSGMKAFAGLSSSLEAGSIAESKAFFASEDEGAWKDSSAAGYLLANAFRTSSTTPPDRLPTVKKWKAFSENVEKMEKAAKKKKADVKSVLAAYELAEAALDEYLESVELPPVIELRK